MLQCPILASKVSIQGLVEWICHQAGWKALYQRKGDPSLAATETADAASGQDTNALLIEVIGDLMSETVATVRPSDQAMRNKSEGRIVTAVVVKSEVVIERIVDESVNEKANDQSAIQSAPVENHGKAADASVAHGMMVEHPDAMSVIGEAEEE